MKKYYKAILSLSILFIIACEATTEPEPTYDGLISEAYQAFTNKNYDLAITKFSSAKVLNSERLEAYLGLGWSYVLKVNFTQAIAELNQAMAIDDTNTDIHASLAFIYNAQGSHSLSNTEIQTTLNIDPAWSFGFGLNLTVTDLYTIQAQNYFLLGEYSSSLLAVREIDSSFTPDINSDAGILELSVKIENLNPGL